MTYQQLQDEPEPLIIEGKNYFIIEASRSCNAQEQIINHLLRQRPGLKEVHSVEECDVILVFCPIVSRAGTDIDAALNKLNRACSETAFRPVIFMVLHPTFDPYKIIPESSRFVNRMKTVTVDFLFSEDEGLLHCSFNDQELNKILCHFKQEMLFPECRSFYPAIIICTIFFIIIIIIIVVRIDA